METLIGKYKKFKERYEKLFTRILATSKFIVFFCLMYVSVVMYKLNRPVESIVLMIVAAIYLMLNKLEGV